MTDCPISRGSYEARARRSARNALLRNGLFALVLLANVVFNLVLRPVPSDLAPVSWGLNVALLALLAWRLQVAWSRLRDVTKHPLYADLARYGDPRTLVAEVEGDCEAGAAVTQGSIVITRRFLVETSWPGDAVRLDDVAWVYPKSVSHSVNFIPVGTTHSLELRTWGPRHRWAGRALTADPALLRLLQERCPTARFGYSLALEAAWKGYCLDPKRPPDGWSASPSGLGR